MFRTRILSLAFASAVTLLIAATATAAPPPQPDHNAGAVYTLTNSAAGNSVAIFGRGADGSLVQQGTVLTGGTGSGAGLGSQGALTIKGNRLFAVNAASNSISELRVFGHGLQLVTTVPSGGTTPISVTASGHTLYVLNAGGAPNITGFSIDGDSLNPIDGSTRPLGPGSSGPAQVSFSSDGKALVVTEKSSSTIDVFAIGKRGVPSLAAASVSSGGTPFGFAFDNQNNLFVSEAAGSASSYELDGGLYPISAAVSTNGQAAPCWIVVTNDGRYAYTANAGSGTISGFAIDHDGNLSLLAPSGISLDVGAGSHPLDEAVSQDGKFFYNLTDLKHGITGARINNDGSLSLVGFYGVLPAGTIGLVAQ